MRVSFVNHLSAVTVSNSSVVQLGDALAVTPTFYGLAVQRAISTFSQREGIQAKDPIYTRPIPIPVVNEQVTMTKIDLQPFISVNQLRVIAMGNASIMQVGTTRYIESEARTKHVRQYATDPYMND